jgi:hypothetical protein
MPTFAKLGITSQKAASGFSCSMTGYSNVVQQIAQLLMIFVTLAINTFKAMIPANL